MRNKYGKKICPRIFFTTDEIKNFSLEGVRNRAQGPSEIRGKTFP